MIDIKLTGLEKAFGAMDAWLADVEETTRRAAIGLIYQGLDIATSRSPQYSGDFVANWKLSYDRIDTSFQAGVFPEKRFPVPDGEVPFQRGDTPAILYAITHSTGKLDGFELGQTLWLANSAYHDEMLEQTYAWLIEDNLVRFRPVNFGGDGPIRQVKEHIETNYSQIGRHNIRTLL